MLLGIVLLGLLGREPGAEKDKSFFLRLRGGPRTLGCNNRKHDAGAGRQRNANVRAKLRPDHPPWSRGMNSVSSAVGSKAFMISLLPPPRRLAAVKPAPVSSWNRLSASATALTSAGSNWCRVSPV